MDVEAVAAALKGAGFPTVVVTCGEMALCCRQSQQSQRARYKGSVLDTPGAGDTFNAALLVARAEGKPPEKQCCLPTVRGIACTEVGCIAAIPYRDVEDDEIHELYAQ